MNLFIRNVQKCEKKTNFSVAIDHLIGKYRRGAVWSRNIEALAREFIGPDPEMIDKRESIKILGESFSKIR